MKIIIALFFTAISVNIQASESQKKYSSSSIYKHVHKPTNIRMPWMVPKNWKETIDKKENIYKITKLDKKN